MLTRTPLLAALLSLAAAHAVVAAETFDVDPAHSEVTFQVRHLVGKVRGRFNEFSGRIVADRDKPEASSVELTIKATSIDTANAQRDTHLRSADFFDVTRFPEISFKSERIVRKADGTYEVEGPLVMHGVTRKVVLPVQVQGPAADPWGKLRVGFEVITTLNRKDYGIIWNQTLDAGGLMLGDDVAVAINLEAVAPGAPPAKTGTK